jgi:NCS2 family nucleobase:cation symporter-2
LLPAFDGHFYDAFPKDFQVIFGSSITATVIFAFVLNIVFNHWGSDAGRESAVQLAVSEGAVVTGGVGETHTP